MAKKSRITLNAYEPRYHARIRLYQRVSKELEFYDRQEVADIANVSYQTITNYEMGNIKLPNPSVLRRVAYAIGIEVQGDL